jgi:hypothetical protein
MDTATNETAQAMFDTSTIFETGGIEMAHDQGPISRPFQ